MIRLVARRVVFGAFVLLGITLITFVLSHVVPGDPARLVAGPHATAEAIARIRALYGLDRPLPIQYGRYMLALARGDFGISLVTRRPVGTDLATFLPATLELAIVALVAGSILGAIVGVVSALRRGTATDGAARLFALLGLSVPAFWVAMLLQLTFYSHLHWLPFGGQLDTGVAPPPRVTGFLTVDCVIAGRVGTCADAWRHLVLPAVTLAVGVAGLMARVVRTSMLEVLSEDYMRTARSKGLSSARILFRHALRNALLPPVTILGLEFGLLAGGVLLVEMIFAWPGLGRYTYQAIIDSDYNAIISVTLVLAFFYVVANVIVDIVYTLIDPRIRYR